VAFLEDSPICPQPELQKNKFKNQIEVEKMSLPCSAFIRSLSYRASPYHASSFEKLQFEMKNIRKLILQYERTCDEDQLKMTRTSYEENISWTRGDDGLDYLIRNSQYPSIVVEFIVETNSIFDGARTVARDLELLRRVHRWFLKSHEIEE